MKQKITVLLLVFGILALSLAGCTKARNTSDDLESSVETSDDGGDSSDLLSDSSESTDSTDASPDDVSGSGEKNDQNQTTGEGGKMITKGTVTATTAATTAAPKDSVLVSDTINDGFTTFYINRPAKGLNRVNAADFGMSPSNADNYQAFSAAIYYCESHPNTELVINKGEYKFTTKQRIKFTELKNIKITANGASFLIRGPLFLFDNSSGIEINGLDIRWDWDYERLADVVKVLAINEGSNGYALDLEFVERSSLTQDQANKMVFKSMSQVDPNTYTFGAGGSHKEIYLGEYYGKPSGITSRTLLGGNKLRVVFGSPNSSLKQAKTGDTLMLFHKVYDQHCINISNSSHITFDKVNIYGAGGMAYCVYGAGTKYVQWVNCKITKDPNRNDAHVSATADGIHMIKCGGYFNIQNCEIAYQGDDAINNGTVCGVVESVVDSHTANIRVGTDSKMTCAVGHTFYVRSNEFEKLEGVKLTVTEIKPGIDGSISTMTFKEQLPSQMKANYIIVNEAIANGHYLIKNNYFHENRARGVVLSSGNGTVEGNRFYKNQMAGLRAGCDIRQGSWQEGGGIENLIIRNNTFDSCVVTYKWSDSAALSIANSLYKQTLKYPAVTNLTITGNIFTNTPSFAILLQNVKNGTVENNTVKNAAAFDGASDSLRGSIMLDTDWAIKMTNNTWEKSAQVPNQVMWKLRYTKEGELTESGNNIQ